ncbi:MAG: hypothetical protein ACR2K0_08440, partial [Acidimicrobiales bacterium]
RRRARPRAAILAAAAALAGVAVTVVGLAGGGSAGAPHDPAAAGGAPAESRRRPPADHAAAPPSSSVGTTLPTGQVWPPPPVDDDACPPVPAPVAADVDGDGCEEGVDVEGGVVRTAGSRWQVATGAEIVLVGDWDCDGSATPAVVRPGSGEVWRYPRWAGAGEDVAAVLGAVVPGAVSATTVERPPGAPAGACDRIEVVDAAGVPTVV